MPLPLRLLRGAAAGIPAYLVIAAGESNAGGFAPNASLTTTEAGPRTEVQMWNVSTSAWENLDIGSNNNLDHAGLNSTTHGIENELANAMAAGRFEQSVLYYLQTGQGGSTIAQWDAGNASGYWSKFVSRYNASKALVPTARPVVFYSQGINDAIAGTAVATWKAATVAHLAKIRDLVGANTLVVLTKFKSTYGAYNTAIDEIVAADSNSRAIQTRDTGIEWQGDGNHWTYRGYKSLCQLFIDQMLASSVTDTPSISPAAGEYASNQTISISGTGTLLYSIDGTDPNIGTVYSAPFVLTLPDTVEARAWQRGRASSSVASATYTLVAAGWDAAEASSGAFLLSAGNTVIASSQNNWRSCRALTGKTTGKWYFELVNEIAATNVGAGIGLANAGYSPATFLGNSAHSIMVLPGTMYRSAGFAGGSAAVFAGGNPEVGAVFMLAVDLDAGRVWFGRGGVWAGSGNPAAGSNQASNIAVGTTGAVWPAIGLFGHMSGGVTTSGRWRIQAASGTTYAPPAGFSAWA